MPKALNVGSLTLGSQEPNFMFLLSNPSQIYSGVLSIKIVILVLNGNASLDYF